VRLKENEQDLFLAGQQPLIDLLVLGSDLAGAVLAAIDPRQTERETDGHVVYCKTLPSFLLSAGMISAEHPSLAPSFAPHSRATV